jgi:protein-tyrosine-phosphatase/DNA-binding transcriptional ArsR family regulator
VRDPTAPGTPAPPPVLFRLAAHPLRWSLLRELAESDRRVRELASTLGLEQSLASYHLGRLRAAGLVGVHRSTADGRDSYYRLDLDRASSLLAAAARSLHPGLATAVPGARPGPGPAPVRVCFLCTGGSARSQMAEALLETLAGGTAAAASAGVRPKPVAAGAIAAMRRRGIDIAGRRPKHVDVLVNERFDYVITLCDRVREVCPEFPADPRVSHWSVPDPSAEAEATGDADGPFERAAADLETRIRFLLHRIAHDTATTEVAVP